MADRSATRRIEELENSFRRAWPLMVCFALLFVPVFAEVAPAEDGEEPVPTGSTSVLMRLVFDSGIDGGLGTTINVVAGITVLGLVAAVCLTLQRLREQGPLRWAMAASLVATVSALLLYILVASNDGTGTLGTDAYQPRWTYLLVLIGGFWLAMVNSE